MHKALRLLGLTLVLQAGPAFPCASQEEVVEALTREVLAGQAESPGKLLEQLVEAGLRSLEAIVRGIEQESPSELETHRELLLGLATEAADRLDQGVESAAYKEKLFDLGLSSLERLGRSREIGTMLHLCAARPQWKLGASHAGRAQRVLQQLLTRGAGGLETLSKAFGRLDPGLKTITLRCIGELETPPALEALIGLVGRDKAFDAAILSRIAALGRKFELPPGRIPFARIRQALNSQTPEVRRQAALCLGVLGDYEGLQQLVGALEDPATPVRQSAHYSLRKLTGFAFELESDNWRRWIWKEERWWREEAPAATRELRSEELAAQVRALKAFASKRLHRGQVISQLSLAVTHSAPPAARLAAIALGRMGALEASDTLIDGLSREDDSLRSACQQALEQIFDLQLPPDREAWRQAIRP